MKICEHRDGIGCLNHAVGLVEAGQGEVLLCVEHLELAVKKFLYLGYTGNVQFWGWTGEVKSG